MPRSLTTPKCPDCGGTDLHTVSVYIGHGQRVVWDECRGCDWHSPDELDCDGV